MIRFKLIAQLCLSSKLTFSLVSISFVTVLFRVVYIYTHICSNIHIHTHTHIYTQTYTYTHTGHSISSYIR